MVYVDDAQIPKNGHLWCHLLADSLAELHAFAASLGLPERAFHRGARHPHYDITHALRETAVAQGARLVSTREAVRIVRAMSLDPR